MDVYLEERGFLIRPNRKDFRAARLVEGRDPFPELGGRKPHSKVLAEVGEYLLLNERKSVVINDLRVLTNSSKGGLSCILKKYDMLFAREPSVNKDGEPTYKRGGTISLSERGYEYFTKEPEERWSNGQD